MYDFVLLFVGHGDTKDVTCGCLDNLHRKTNYRFESRWITGDALIGRSRSRAVSQFLWTEDSPYMIFVDTDIAFKPEHIEKIYRSLQAGYHIIAGAYSTAGARHLAVRGYGAVTFNNTITEMQYVSTGFMGISRQCLKDIRDRLNLPLLHKGDWAECWPFFESGAVPEEGIYISEDWHMCNLARKAGYKVYLHTGVMVGHMKERLIPAEEALENMMKKEEQREVNLPQSSLYDDLKTYLQEPEDFNKEVLSGDYSVTQEWNNWQGLEEEFYRTSEKYIFDLAEFNHRTNYWKERIAPIWNFKGQTVCDVGSGIGSLALHLGLQRNKVIGYEINDRCRDFAEWRRQQFGLSNVSFVSEMPDMSECDVVTAIDVLEHIKDLREFLVELGQKMKPDAKFYHADMFDDKDHPMHHNHGEKIDEYLKEAGFAVFDQKWAIKK